jgi:chromosomal replication initiator protein
MPLLDWKATLDVMRESVPQTQFQNWLDPLELLRSDDKTICLGVPSRFHETWIRSHYASKLHDIIRDQTGSSLQLEFEILKDQGPTVPSAPSSEPPPTSAPRPLPQRPNLRIVDGHTENHAAEGEETFSPEVERATLPPFPNLFLDAGFNNVAVQCAKIFTEGKDWQLSTFVIYAGVGMGKTHLLSDMGREIQKKQPSTRIRYVTAEAFTNEMVMSYKNDSNRHFKTKYQDKTDVLLFDDIHSLSNRSRTQEQLLHIFNEITSRGGRVAFTSSVPLQRLEGFIDPLKSRLLSCVMAEIKQPSFDEKVELLGRICYHNQMGIAPEVIRTLADRGHRDVRELVGSLFRIHLQARLENRTLDASFLAREGWIRESQRQVITMEEIVSLVEHNYAVSRTDLMSKGRKSSVAWARQVAMYLGRKFTQLSLEQIGKAFGRDHATAIYAFDKVIEMMKEHPTKQYEVEFLVQKLQARAPKPAAE